MVQYHRPELDRVFGAVADPTRRAILDALARGPARITDLARPFPVSLNAISKHVKILERAGLVARDVVGREHYCRLETERLREAAAWLERHKAFWESRLDALARHVTKRRQAERRAAVRRRGDAGAAHARARTGASR